MWGDALRRSSDVTVRFPVDGFLQMSTASELHWTTAFLQVRRGDLGAASA